MFHAKRARQDQGADNPIDGSSAAQSALGQPTEHLPSSSSPGQPVTVHGRAAARNILVRPGLLLLALAAVTILGGVLVAAASATTQDMGARQAEHASPTAGLPERLAQTTQTTQTNQARDQPPLIPARALVQLVLDPAQAAIGPGERQAYTAKVLIQLGPHQAYTAEKPDTYSYSFDVTRLTRFKIIPDGSCTKVKGKVSCSATDIGPHTVTGILPPGPRVPYRPRGTAVLHVDRPFDHLDLQPAATSIELGASQGYIAYGVADGADPVDVTTQTVFTIKELNGSCVGASCTATEPGDYTVIGTLTRDGRRTVGGTAKLRVLPRQPSISSVTPASTLPGRSVEVRGNTGSCNRAGTLTFHGMTEDVSTDVTADENGNFVARFTVPRGTFQRAYKLELTVDCNRQLQWVQSELTVINLAPVAVDDSATTTQDTPVAIAVAANDRNPDPDTGYQTVVVEHRSPPHGTIQVRSDRTIVYTPETGFLGRDQFQYSLCDNIINAAGQADCGTATVTVTVNPRTLTTTTTTTTTTSVPPTSVPPTSVPPTSVPPTTTSP